MHHHTAEFKHTNFQRQTLALAAVGASMLVLFGALIALLYLAA